MVKRLHLTLFLLFFISSFAGAADRYWVGGSGNWENELHWSAASGGKGGASVPGEFDHIVFDKFSFTAEKQSVTIGSDLTVSDVSFVSLAFKPAFIIAKGISFTLAPHANANNSWKDELLSYISNEVKEEEHEIAPYPQIPQKYRDMWNKNHDLRSGTDPSIFTHSCSAFVTVQVSCPANATNVNSTNPPLNCNGQATVTVLPPVGPYAYIWSTIPTQTTQTATGLCSGSYTGFVIDTTQADSCPFAVFVNGIANFNPGYTKVRPLCNGGNDGSITLNLSGGTGPYSYSWSPTGQLTQTATGLTAGNYTFFIIDNNGCTFTASTSLTQPTPLALSFSQVNEPCFNNCVGTATVNVSGGTPGYTYSWSTTPTQSTVTATGLCAGTYTCFVKDANQCPIQHIFTITQPPQLLINSITTTNNPVLCNGVCNATATANASGGTPTYSYSWAPTGQLTQTATGLCAGTYTVTVADQNGCTRTGTVVISQPTVLTVVPSTTNNPLLCNGSCIATATATAGGGIPPYLYSWTTSPVQTTPTATGLCAGTYTCTVTDNNGCTNTTTVTITQPPPIVPNVTTTNNPLACFGNCNATATANPSGGTPGYNYSWAPGGQLTQGISNLCAGTYTCFVRDANNCVVQQVITITQPTQITINITTTNNPVPCNTNCIATATANVNGGTPGYTFSWNPTGQLTQTATGLCAGNYTVTVTDAAGCTRTGTVSITQPPLLVLTLNATTLLCNGACNATIGSTVSGGVAPYTYSWWNNNATTPSLNNQCAGSYTLTVTDANGCTQTAIINVTQPTALTLATATNPASCNLLCNGSASAIAGGGTPGYTYSWSPGGQNTTTITNQCAGSYTITVTDANGCTISATVTITQPPPIVPGVTSTNVLCNGACNGTATANPSGGTPGYSYSWAPNGAVTPGISNLCPGSYTVTITDLNGCTATQVVNITQPPPLGASAFPTGTACNICNGSATVNVFGGTPAYSYSWSNGQTTQNATGLCPGTYTVTITDANGCTTIATATVVQTVVITITSSSTSLFCFNDSSGTACANALGGQLPYAYLWTPTNPFQTTQCATGLTAGTYTVNVTDANGCTGIDSVTFTNPPQLIASSSFTNLSCNNACDGTANGSAVGGTGGVSYSWAPGGQTTQTATGLCAGIYTLTVTDGNGCTDTATVNITQAQPITANPVIVNTNCSLCNGSITVSPTGGVPGYTYSWVPGNFTTPTINNLCVGLYTVFITDAANCTTQDTFAINPINGPNVTLIVTNATCNGTCDGTINANVVGGTSPYTYSWSPGNQTTTGISNLCAGNYILTVTDAAGCSAFTFGTVAQPQPIVPNATVVNSSCANQCNGSISLSPTGGNPGYQYSWLPGNQNTSSINGLCAGSYFVTITDVNGCTDTATFVITSPTLLTTTITSTNVLCNGDCNGTGTVTPSGGTPPYTYSWAPNSSILPNVVNLCPGSYTVFVTDLNGCTTTDTITITQPTPIISVNSFTDATCFGICDGTATVNPSGGTPGYAYSWSPGGQLTQTATGLCPGTYQCTITDANGCTILQSVTVGQPLQILPNVTTIPVSCNGTCNGSATATPSGGSGGPYSFSWSPGNMVTQTVNGLCAGQYTVTVTDGNGCTGTQIVNITQPAPLIANPSTAVPATCGNLCNGSLTANPIGGTGPYSYSWVPGGQLTQTATGLCPGTTYSVYVTDANGCTDMQSFLMIGPNTLTATFSVAQANCGVCDGQVTASGSGGTAPYSYSWWNNNATTPGISNLCAGLYTVTVTDFNGCTQDLTIGVSNTTGPILTMSTTQTSCPNVCDGSVMVVANGNSPFTYQWTQGLQTTASVTGECAGSYTVLVTDAGLCITLDSVQVTSPSVILDNAVVVNATCNGICDGSITLAASGANGGPYSYSWWNNGATTPGINNLCVGLYTVSVTDINGCRDTFTYNILGSTNIVVATSSTNINCSNTCNGTATVTSTIGGVLPYIYGWSDPSGQFTTTATGLCAGTFTVFVTDANGCIGTDSITITQTPPVTATSSVVAPSCGQCNGQLTANPSGGVGPYTISWSTNATTNTITGVCAGVYSAVITDANGCTALVTFPVSNASTLADPVAVTNATCFSSPCTGSATANPSGGTPPYTFNWIPGGQTTPTVNNLCPGTYFVQVTDAAGCIRTDSVVISSPTQILSNQLVTNTACGTSNGSIVLNPSGGTGPYTYLWSNAATTASITGLSAGTYTVTITDATGCTQQYVIAITAFNGETVTVTPTNVSCGNGPCDGTAAPTVLGGTAPYTFSWSTGATTPTVAGLCAGSYWVQVTDANGCTAVTIFTITQPPVISFSTAIAQSPLCNNNCNGSVTVIPSGGTLPFSYLWSGPNSFTATTPTITGLCAGTYTCVVTDANGCTSQQVITLINPAVLNITNVITPASCNTVADGGIDITVTGGTSGYTYSWSPGNATTQDLNNVLSGTYTVTITDANGCTVTATITITSTISVIADAGVNDTLCFGGCSLLLGTASVNANSYQWIDLATMTTISNNDSISVCPGVGNNTYILICTNGPCTDTDTVVVVVDPLPTVDAGQTQSILVNSSTTIGGNPTGPSGSTYSWSPVTGLSCTTCSNPTASPSVTTTYTVTVTSPQGCTASDTVTVIVVPEIIFPNGISPNGDGANDEWIIDNINLYPNCVVEIYNRWGELLFRSVGYPPDGRWKGIYKGEELPVGTYYYIIDLKSEFYPDAFTGPITLMR